MELKNAITQYIKHKAETKTSTKRLVNELGELLAPMYAVNGMEIPLQSLTDILSTVNSKKITSYEIDYGILKAILAYQCDYYLLLEENDEEITNKYLALYDNYVEIYDTMINDAKNLIDDEFNTMLSFKFQVDILKPMAQNILELNRFTDAAKTSIKIIYKAFEGMLDEMMMERNEAGIMPFWLFHRDIIGNEREWRYTVLYWLECYYIYKKYVSLNKKKAELVRHLIGLDIFNYINLTEKDMSNSIHKVDKYINEAERLIASAKRGTFPI